MSSKIYFSDYFAIPHKTIEEYGALDISLKSDNPAFVDPFLIFANKDYKHLHDFIVQYLMFLRKKSLGDKILTDGDFKHYYRFSEINEVWLGYSKQGNKGLGLGRHFGNCLHKNLLHIFNNFGNETITQSPHLEKLCLIDNGIGIDKISDFTLNLIKEYLLEYTQKFALSYLEDKFIKEFAIRKVNFNFHSELWEDAKFKLPISPFNTNHYILLVPQNILTKNFTWISKNDFLNKNSSIFTTIENNELRTKLNHFFISNLSTKIRGKKIEPDLSKKSKEMAMKKVMMKYPEVIDYYIRSREDNMEEALENHIAATEDINFYYTGKTLVAKLTNEFKPMTAFEDCFERLMFFKKVLEENSKDLNVRGISFQEKNLQLLFKLVLSHSIFDYNAEVNNGRGPIDFIVSLGAKDKIGLEFKLASNTQLKYNLKNQVRIYAENSNLQFVITVIFFFSEKEREKVYSILKELNMSEDNKNIILINCIKKTSASNVK